jgi:hypothetical protein
MTTESVPAAPRPAGPPAVRVPADVTPGGGEREARP